ncbi:unnamed protein product [Amaranthus hypochondriacus]
MPKTTKPNLEVDEHGFRPLKKTYRPRSQAIQDVIQEKGEAAEHPPPIQIPNNSQTIAVEQQVSSLPSDVLVQQSDSQHGTEVVKLQLPRLVLRQEPVLPISNGFGVLSMEQGGDSNNAALGADPIREHD